MKAISWQNYEKRGTFCAAFDIHSEGESALIVWRSKKKWIKNLSSSSNIAIIIVLLFSICRHTFFLVLKICHVLLHLLHWNYFNSIPWKLLQHKVHSHLKFIFISIHSEKRSSICWCYLNKHWGFIEMRFGAFFAALPLSSLHRFSVWDFERK